ncbi:MAG: hypothetical protein AAFU64_08125, partial [Bacteroidota bacterium]
ENKALPDWLNSENLNHYYVDRKYQRGVKMSPVAPGVYQLYVHDPKQGRTFTINATPLMRIASMLRFSPDYWQTQYEEALAKVQKREAEIRKVNDVFRSVEISEFGIYNYDRLLKMTEALVVKADFTLKGAEERPQLVYYINRNLRAVIPYKPKAWEKVSLTADSSSRIFAILPDFKVAVFRPEDYQKIDFEKLRKEEKSSFHFKLVAYADALDSREDLEKALGLY